MVQVKGKYKHEKSENFDEYLADVGVPYLVRKMIGISNPTVEISEDENGVWTISTKTLVRSTDLKFKLGEEYEEVMQSDVVLKNVTTLTGDKLETVSHSNTGIKVLRTYTFTEEGMVLTMVNEKSGKTAKRYFTRI